MQPRSRSVTLPQLFSKLASLSEKFSQQIYAQVELPRHGRVLRLKFNGDAARQSDLAAAIINRLIDAYKAKLAATNTQDRVVADLAAKEIEAEIEARKQASSIIIAEQGRWYTAIIRPLLAFPIIIYFWKIIVWDKVLGLGSTDPITGMAADWAGMIITAYVGGRSIEKVARIFRRQPRRVVK